MNQDKSSLAWTRRHLSEAAKSWLRDLPRDLDYAGVHLVHASNRQGHNVWPYVREPERLRDNFGQQQHAICFNGHTHHPALGVQQEDGAVEFLELAEEMPLPAHCKVLINPGSVGQPRDGDPRAAALIFETRDRSVRFLRVEYDIAATAAAIREHNLPERFCARLEKGR